MWYTSAYDDDDDDVQEDPLYNLEKYVPQKKGDTARVEYKANKVVSSRPDDDGRHGMDLFIVYIISWGSCLILFFRYVSNIFVCVVAPMSAVMKVFLS